MSLGFLNPETQTGNRVKNLVAMLPESPWAEVKSFRGITFFESKSQTDKSLLQPTLYVVSLAVNLNVYVCICALKQSSTPAKAKEPTLQKCLNNDTEPNINRGFGFKVQNANRVCCVRACPASRVYMPIYETQTLSTNPTCV